MTHDDDARWQRKDVWYGVLFTGTGALTFAYAILACRNGVPMMLWGTAMLFGPLLLFLGMNSIVRSLRAKR